MASGVIFKWEDFVCAFFANTIYENKREKGVDHFFREVSLILLSAAGVMEGSDYDEEEDYVPKSEKRTQLLREEAVKEKDLMEKARNSKIERIWGKGVSECF